MLRRILPAELPKTACLAQSSPPLESGDKESVQGVVKEHGEPSKTVPEGQAQLDNQRHPC